MEASLQSLLDLAGVNAAMVYDGAGRLVAQRGKAVYDRALCEQVGGPLSRAVDSIAFRTATGSVIPWLTRSAAVAETWGVAELVPSK